MANFVKISIYNNGKNLGVIDYKGDEMFVLGFYLTDDVYIFDSWKKWILDDAREDTCSNFSYQNKQDDGTILIGFLHSDDLEPHIVVKKEQLLQLLEVWTRYRSSEKESELTIYQEGDDIRWEIIPQRGKIRTFLLSLWSRIKRWLCV